MGTSTMEATPLNLATGRDKPHSWRLAESPRRHCGLAMLVACTAAALLGTLARGDHFDDHNYPVLKTAWTRAELKPIESMGISELAAAPHVVVGQPAAAFFLLKSDDGNWVKLLARQARRKKPGGDLVDFLLLERVVAYSGSSGRVLHDRRDLHLYAGFCFDADMGQTVPSELGCDLTVVMDGDRPVLRCGLQAKLALVTAPLVPPAPGPARQFGQGAVRPTDFAGTFRLDGDGRWSGELVLEVSETGEVKGSYQSHQTGNRYPLAGKVGPPANHIRFKITFPMAEQTFEGYLWTRGRQRLAGITVMQDRPFGFVADRVK